MHDRSFIVESFEMCNMVILIHALHLKVPTVSYRIVLIISEVIS